MQRRARRGSKRYMDGVNTLEFASGDQALYRNQTASLPRTSFQTAQYLFQRICQRHRTGFITSQGPRSSSVFMTVQSERSVLHPNHVQVSRLLLDFGSHRQARTLFLRFSLTWYIVWIIDSTSHKGKCFPLTFQPDVSKGKTPVLGRRCRRHIVSLSLFILRLCLSASTSPSPLASASLVTENKEITLPASPRTQTLPTTPQYLPPCPTPTPQTPDHPTLLSLRTPA
jgi:hypothetical protein